MTGKENQGKEAGVHHITAVQGNSVFKGSRPGVPDTPSPSVTALAQIQSPLRQRQQNSNAHEEGTAVANPVCTEWDCITLRAVPSLASYVVSWLKATVQIHMAWAGLRKDA